MKFDPNYTITLSLTKQLLEIERHKEAIDILPVTAPLIASLRETARLMSTHYSTQIEGNALTKEEVRKVAEGKKGGFPGRERDEREVRNYFRALEYVEQELKSGSKLTEKLIKTTHSFVLLGSKKATPYREGQNVIKDAQSGGIVYMPPEAHDVAPLMKGLADWINESIQQQELPAPIIAGLAHYQFATIHPYYDGNGRTARLLTTFILHKTGYGMKGIYSLEEYYAKNKNEYYKALTIGKSHNYYGGRAEADVTPFLDYFLSGMAVSFRSVREKAQELKDHNKEQKIMSYQTETLRELKPQQRQVFSLFEKSKEVTTNDVAEHLGLSTRSAHGLVKKWLEGGFVEIVEQSRKSRTYSLSKEWEQLISVKQRSRLEGLENLRDKGKDQSRDMER
ncbi:Fic family protein [uncultured Psychroserpens sp.]|uniref:Fic family protein n=1 Tax=uncultured Psychroserpens sp. TaxID=255436 RepID=UPI002629A1D6|nr:Fic family protein [uncultured Psychroserpens sp.]